MKTTYYSHVIEVFRGEDADKRFVICIDGAFVSTKAAYTAEEAVQRAKDYIKAHSKSRK